jgi:hypothetical protein
MGDVGRGIQGRIQGLYKEDLEFSFLMFAYKVSY